LDGLCLIGGSGHPAVVSISESPAASGPFERVLAAARAFLVVPFVFEVFCELRYHLADTSFPCLRAPHRISVNLLREHPAK